METVGELRVIGARRHGRYRSIPPASTRRAHAPVSMPSFGSIDVEALTENREERTP